MGERSACESNLPGRSQHHRLKNKSTLQRRASSSNVVAATTTTVVERQQQPENRPDMYSSNANAAAALLSFRHANVEGMERSTTAVAPAPTSSSSSIVDNQAAWRSSSLMDSDAQSVSSSAVGDHHSVNSNLFDEQHQQHRQPEPTRRAPRSSRSPIFLKEDAVPQQGDVTITSSSQNNSNNFLMMPPLLPPPKSRGFINAAPLRPFGCPSSSSFSRPQTVSSSSFRRGSAARCIGRRSSLRKPTTHLPQGKPMPLPPSLAKHLIHMTRPIKIVLH